MRNFCVVCVLLGVALFCQGFSVAPRTCRQPSCLQFGKLGGRVGVVETLAEVNEKNITEVSERLSKQMNEVEHRLSARIDAVSAETRADVPATREALSATEFSARTEAMRAEIKEGVCHCNRMMRSLVGKQNTGNMNFFERNGTTTETTMPPDASNEGGMMRPGGPMMMPPTELDLRRERVLSIVPRFSGSLSMLGSLIVALKVIQNIRKGEGKSYSYIILTMCAVDFCSSLAFAFSTLPMELGKAPKFGQSYRYGAQGTEGTCTTQAFFIQFGIAIIFLNFLLSLHYLATIRWRMREHQLRKYVFPGIVLVLLIGIGLSVTPLVLEAYAYNPLWCWIGPNVPKCKEEGLTLFECRERTYQRRDMFYFFPLWTMVGLTTFVQCWLVWTVFRTVRRANKWRFGEQMNRRRSSSIKMMKRREKKARREMASTRRVALQSFLYLASFYVAWIPWIVAANRNQHIDNVLTDHSAFWLVLCVTVTQPLQGFLNCLAYFHTTIVSHVSRMACICCKKSEGEPESSNGGEDSSGMEEGLDRANQELDNDDKEDPVDVSSDSMGTHDTEDTTDFLASELYTS